MYADDTQLLRPLNPDNLEEQMQAVDSVQDCISKVSQWMFDNKLKLNEEKTEFMIIGKKRHTNKMVIDSLILDGEKIESSKSVRNLGVITDSELNMKDHISHVSKNCYYQPNRIHKIRSFLSATATKRLVHALVISRLDYCNALFYGINESLLDKLQRVQNAAARVIANKRKYDHISKVMEDLHWLKIRERIHFKLLVWTYKSLNGIGPEYLSDMLSYKSNSRTLRSTEQMYLAQPNFKLKTCGYRAFQVSAPRLWNNLPKCIREIDNITAFRKSLKTHLFPISYS